MKRQRDIFAAIVDAAEAGRHVHLSSAECAVLATHPDIAKKDASALYGEWRAIAGYPNYQVSSDGRVRKGGRTLRATLSRYGHKKVTLYNGTKHGPVARGRRIQVHHLVALAFIGQPPFKGAIVRHKNGHAEDNTVANLTWGTHEENTQDRVHHYRFGKPEPVPGTWTYTTQRFRYRQNKRTINELGE